MNGLCPAAFRPILESKNRRNTIKNEDLFKKIEEYCEYMPNINNHIPLRPFINSDTLCHFENT